MTQHRFLTQNECGLINLKKLYLLLSNSLCCWKLILSTKKNIWRNFLFNFWNLKWEKLNQPNFFFHLPLPSFQKWWQQRRRDTNIGPHKTRHEIWYGWQSENHPPEITDQRIKLSLTFQKQLEQHSGPFDTVTGEVMTLPMLYVTFCYIKLRHIEKWSIFPQI